MSKTLWCPTCKEFPDEIVEFYASFEEVRKWDGEDTYELVESSISDLMESICRKCNSTLLEKEEEKNDDKTPLSKVL